METDEYTITLCPLHNATQTKISGNDNDDGAAPAKPISLDGMVRTSDMRVIAKRVEARRREKNKRDEKQHIANNTRIVAARMACSNRPGARVRQVHSDGLRKQSLVETTRRVFPWICL